MKSINVDDYKIGICSLSWSTDWIIIGGFLDKEGEHYKGVVVRITPNGVRKNLWVSNDVNGVIEEILCLSDEKSGEMRIFALEVIVTSEKPKDIITFKLTIFDEDFNIVMICEKSVLERYDVYDMQYYRDDKTVIITSNTNNIDSDKITIFDDIEI